MKNGIAYERQRSDFRCLPFVGDVLLFKIWMLKIRRCMDQCGMKTLGFLPQNIG